MFQDAFKGKVVWVSGSTGFKGAWLAEWLLRLGAEVRGFALEPESPHSLYDQLRLGERIRQEMADIRDPAQVRRSICEARPDFVFHLAAQSLVRRSYVMPVETYMSNVMGTVHVLDALRALDHPCTAVMVTTDKCYENREWVYGYREEDALGGHDPYSSSKAAAEVAINCWRRSFLATEPARVASARAGNVIGGGDWAEDRIIPDCIRALQRNQPIRVRNPRSTRPWQHVLESLSGYLWLAACLSAALDGAAKELSSAFNFGSARESNRTTGELVSEVLLHWPGRWEDVSDPAAPHEAWHLHLCTDKAFSKLGWTPVWSFADTVRATVLWYREVAEGRMSAEALTARQILNFEEAASKRALPWADVVSAEGHGRPL